MHRPPASSARRQTQRPLAGMQGTTSDPRPKDLTSLDPQPREVPVLIGADGWILAGSKGLSLPPRAFPRPAHFDNPGKMLRCCRYLRFSLDLANPEITLFDFGMAGATVDPVFEVAPFTYMM